MLKTIKKALLLSSFVFASVLPMRQVGQVALANALPIRKVAQIALAKLVNQSASFHNSSVARSPFVFGTLSAMPHMDVDESVDKSTEESIDESADEPVEMDNQDVGTNHRVFFDNNTKSWGVDLHGGAGAPDLRRFLPNDVTQDRSSSNDREQAECLSEIKDDLKLAYKEQARFEYDESQYSYYVEKFPTIIQDKACELVKSYSSLSRHELSSEHNTLSSTRKILEEKLQSLAQKNTNVWHIVQEAQYGFNSVVIPYCDRSRWKGKDYDYVLATLDLISDIESIKVATRECDARISKFDQEARDFVSALERSSSDVIEEKIMPGLMGKKEKNAFCIAQKEDELNHQKNKLKDINAQIESFNNRSIWVRGKARFKELFDSNQNPDDIKKGLEDDKKDLKAEIAKTSRQLQSLYHQQKEYDSQVVQAQKIVQEKRKIELQEAQILEEKQKQEAQLLQEKQKQDVLYEEMIKNYHDSCNFDITNCPDRELENQWSQRQEALSKTIEQGYAQYNQEFHLTPQTAGFLATHGIDYNDYQGFCGTALQQQLHGEMCDLFSEAAIMQLQFSHQKNLLTSIVDFVDAAHDANKNKQVLLASQLMSVGWIGFKLNRQIVDAAIPYGKAGVSGIVHSATGFLNMAAHPIETFKGLCKAIYFALETMAANDPEPLFDNPELRDQINAKVAAGLKILGEKMANSTGPERFGALTSIVADSVIPGKIIHAVGGVCGIVRSQAKGMRSLEGIASLAEDQGVAREVMQAAELEIAVQEKVAKTLASELMEAGKNGGKVASGSKATPPRTFADKKASALRKAQRIEKITETLPDGRIRYYEAERPSSTPGPTRGRSFVTEFDPKTGRVRQWNEYYNHCGNVNRVRPKMINGRTVVSQHYPATYADIQNNIKGSKWHIPEKTLD